MGSFWRLTAADRCSLTAHILSIAVPPRLCACAVKDWPLLADQAPKAWPVKKRSGIGLASGRNGDVRMADEILDRIGAHERAGQPCQHRVLGIGEMPIIGALELDADGEIIAATAATPFGLPRMPGTQTAGYELDQCSVATDEEVAGTLRFGDLPIVGMVVRFEAIGNQVDDAGAAELAGRQTDVVNHQQLDGCIVRPVIEIRGGNVAGRGKQPAVVQVPCHRDHHAAVARVVGTRYTNNVNPYCLLTPFLSLPLHF